jgi:hypothetical protein
VFPILDDWEIYEYNAATDAEVVICDGPCILGNLFFATAISAHAIPVLDGATTKVTLPASIPALAQLTTLRGTRFESSLRVNSDNAATGTIYFQFKRL